MTPHLIAYIVLLLSTLFALCVMLRWDLQMQQQNSYYNSRYRKWLKQSGELTSAKRLLILAALLGVCTTMATMSWIVVVVIALILVALSIGMLRKKHKKPLVFTKRVARIYFTALTIALIAIVLAGYWGNRTSAEDAARCACIVAVLALFWSFAIAMLANWLLGPIERHINNRYINDARCILQQMPNLKVIGITGSYGKTSTKHFLHRILSEQFSVAMTPGNYNTTLGVVRTIREHLQPYNQLFICEMGAKNVGDIQEICDIVHPSMAIITAVGPQHLESFKTIENVQKTKFELVDALPSNGLAMLNNDFPYIANRQVDNVTTLRYSMHPDDQTDCWASDVHYSTAGTQFTFHIKDTQGTVNDIDLQTRLVGECNISNIIAAVALALQLGMPTDKIQYAVSHIEPVEHRLNIKRAANGLTIIDDAYNSNPSGSRMALDVLSQMTSGKRIVITPGMIELGSQQQELNRQFGEHIATSCDVAIIVGQYNRQAIVEGINQVGFPSQNLHTVDSFAQAQQLLLSMAIAGDTVLYENDLPDSFK